MVVSIVFWLQDLLQKHVPEVALSPLAGSQHGKLRLSPEQLLAVINAVRLAEWALRWARRWRPLALPGRAGGRPQEYSDTTILLMAVV